MVLVIGIVGVDDDGYICVLECGEIMDFLYVLVGYRQYVGIFIVGWGQDVC